jgi:hypothetical protein
VSHGSLGTWIPENISFPEPLLGTVVAHDSSTGFIYLLGGWPLSPQYGDDSSVTDTENSNDI